MVASRHPASAAASGVRHAQRREDAEWLAERRAGRFSTQAR